MKHKKRKKILQLMKRYQKKTNLIIAGFSGIGKTYLGNKYQNVIDLDAASYAYTDIELENLNMEERKGLKRSPNKDFPNNYIKAIEEAKKQYDIILTNMG